VLASLYLPNPRSECCSYPFSDSLRRGILRSWLVRYSSCIHRLWLGCEPGRTLSQGFFPLWVFPAPLWYLSRCGVRALYRICVYIPWPRSLVGTIFFAGKGGPRCVVVRCFAPLYATAATL